MNKMFPSDYPPGCHSVPDYEPAMCEVCGGDHGLGCPDEPGSCICPDCPKCGQFGDPNCYRNHGLVITWAQANQLKTMEEMREDENKIDPDSFDPADSILD